MRLALRHVAVALAVAGCSSSPRPTGRDGRTAEDPPVASDGATREPGDPPLVLACENAFFAGTQPLQIAHVGGGLIVASSRNERLYVTMVDDHGRVQTVRPSLVTDRLIVPHGGDTLPRLDKQGHVHFTVVNPESQLVDVDVGPEEGTVRSALYADGLVGPGGLGAWTGDQLLGMTIEDHGSTNIRDWQEVLDLFELSSRRRLSRVDPGCTGIAAIIATDWGFAFECTAWDGAAATSRGNGPSGDTSIVGVVDGQVAWRVPVERDVWWTALGSDGEHVLVVENVSRQSPDRDDGRPYPVRTLQLDATGNTVGDPLEDVGRVPSQGSRRLVWTGKEYAGIEWHAITRYDSDGHVIGTWRFEPDCSRELADVQLTWTGSTYAVCGWHRTLFDADNPSNAASCEANKHGLTAYPALVYDPEESGRRAPVGDE